MKKWILWILIVLLLGITGCKDVSEKETADTGEGNTLFMNAAPQNGMMQFFYYNRDGGYTEYFFNNIKEKEIVESLSQVTAVPVEMEDVKVKYPMYGIRIPDKQGQGIQMLWTNGYLITRQGDAYKFQYDWKSLYSELEWEEDMGSELAHAAEMPNVRYLALEKDAWNRKWMKPAEEPVVPDGIHMALDSWGHNSVKVTLHNDNEEPWMYGRMFRLDVRIKNKWYEVPQVPDSNWGFTSEAIQLAPEKDNEENFGIYSFGYLPEGTYRLVLIVYDLEGEDEGLFVVHEIENTAEEVWKSYPLEPAEEPVAPDGVTVELDAWTDESIKVTVINDSKEDFSYGTFCRIDVLLDDVWYTLPDPDAYTLQGILVVPGMERKAEFSVDQYGYGRLPKGTYRFVLEGLTIEHTIS